MLDFNDSMQFIQHQITTALEILVLYFGDYSDNIRLLIQTDKYAVRLLDIVVTDDNYMTACKAPICPTAHFTVAPREWKVESTLWG